MKIALSPFSKHYASYTFYCTYVLLWIDTWRTIPKLRHVLDGGLVPLFGVFTAIAFIIISILNAIFRSKDQRKFYLWLILFIIIPPANVIVLLLMFK